MPRNFMRKRDANEFSDTLIESDDSSKTISQVDTGEFKVKSKIWTKNMPNGDRPNIFQEQIDNLISNSFQNPRVSIEKPAKKSIPQDTFKLPAPKTTQRRRKPRQLSPSESVSRGAPSTSFNNRAKSLYNGNSSRYPRSEYNRFSNASRKYGEERIMDYGEEDRRMTDLGRSRLIRDNESCCSTRTNGLNCVNISVPVSMLLKGSEEGEISTAFVVKLMRHSQNHDLAYQDIQVPDRISQLDARSVKSRMSVVSRAPSIISRARNRKSFKSIRGQRNRKSLHRRGSSSCSDESDDSREPTLEEEEVSQTEFRQPSIEGLKVLKQNRNSSGGQRAKKKATPQQPKKKSTPQPTCKSPAKKKTPLQELVNKSQRIFENAETQNDTQPSIIKRKLFSQSSEMIDNDPLRTRVSVSPSPVKSKSARPKLSLNKVRLSSNSRLSLQSLIKSKSPETGSSKGVATFIGLPLHESSVYPGTAHRFLHAKPSSAMELILANSELQIQTNVTINTPIIPKSDAKKDHNSGENSSQSDRESDATIIHKTALEKNELAPVPKSTKWLTDGSDDNDTDVERNEGCKSVAPSEKPQRNQDIRQSARKNKQPPKLWLEESVKYVKATEMEIKTDIRQSTHKNKKPPKLLLEECDNNVKATEMEIKTAPETKQPPPKKLRTESKIEAVNQPKSKNFKEGTAPAQTAKSTMNDVPPQEPGLNNKKDSMLSNAAKAQMPPYNNKRLKAIFDSSREYSRTPRRSPRMVCKNKYFQSRYPQTNESDLKTVTARSRAQFPKTPIEIKNNLKEMDISKLSPILKTKAISPIQYTSKDINETIDKIKKKSQPSYTDKNMDINDVLKKVDDHVRGSKRASLYNGGVISDDEEAVAHPKRAPLERIENRISKSSKSVTSFALFNKSMANRFKPRETPGIFSKGKPEAPSESNYRYNCGKTTISRGSSFKSTKSARFGHYFF